MSIILTDRGNIIPQTTIRPKNRQVVLVFYKSVDGETNWQPVPPEDVPAFCKTDDCLRRFIAGDMAQAMTQTGDGPWYRAEEQVQH